AFECEVDHLVAGRELTDEQPCHAFVHGLAAAGLRRGDGDRRAAVAPEDQDAAEEPIGQALVDWSGAEPEPRIGQDAIGRLIRRLDAGLPFDGRARVAAADLALPGGHLDPQGRGDCHATTLAMATVGVQHESVGTTFGFWHPIGARHESVGTTFGFRGAVVKNDCLTFGFRPIHRNCTQRSARAWWTGYAGRAMTDDVQPTEPPPLLSYLHAARADPTPEHFRISIRRTMDEMRLRDADLAQAMQVSRTTVMRWREGHIVPSHLA